ncbi:hypothetical protein SAMN02746041_03320 [Desulfacinum hydrothermale DSM 13146]|uniref:Uncharacterized protein n=1 Tax=Desulfacinum hydrothermale DSM 13146 TaxID=1121390 RepID=A0A1W1XZ49_9BACT|nr:hypothetical protein SAMN02746041_03320 [Desulfacinum hydrothermale DSM 13146]
MKAFRTVRSQAPHGAVDVFTDFYVGHYDHRPNGNCTLYLHAISLYGSPTAVRAVSATILQGHSVLLHEYNMSTPYELCTMQRPGGSPMRQTSVVLDEGRVAHKLMWNPMVFSPWSDNEFCSPYSNTYLVWGQTEDEAKEHLYRTLDAVYPTPLCPEWKNWLWEEFTDNENLTCFSTREEFNVVRRVDLPMPEVFQSHILDSLKSGALTVS